MVLRLNVRRDFTQAKFNDENSTFLFGQILVVSIILGLVAQSWWIFGLVLIGLIVSLRFKKVALVVCFLLALAWGGLGVAIGNAFESLGASVVLAIIGFLIGLGGNLSGLQWFNDVSGIPDEEDDYYGDEEDGEYADCPDCGEEYILGEMLFCNKCGTKLPEESSMHSLKQTQQSICSKCNASLIKDATFCSKCGNKI